MPRALLHRGALATSGDYERCIEVNGRRFGHILNPTTGWPVQGLCSVSVISEQCLLPGTVCTTSMLKGDRGPDWLASLDLPYLWMDEHGGHGQHSWPASAYRVAA